MTIYLNWKEAKEAAIALDIKSYKEYGDKYKQDSRLPSAPNLTYKGTWNDNLGWKGFLCTKVTIEIFKSARKGSRLTQKEAGLLLGVSSYEIALKEKGDKYIDVAQYKLVRCFRYLSDQLKQDLLGEDYLVKFYSQEPKPVKRKSSFMVKTERTIKAYDLIQSSPGGVGFDKLLRILKCSRPTLYRMVNDLKLIDPRIYIEQREFKIYGFIKSRK